MLLIGDLAELAGISRSAIRYYEEIGLVRPAARQSGRRLFNEDADGRLRAIVAARGAGFSLDEVRRLLDSQAEGSGEWRRLVQSKIADVEDRIRRLRLVAGILTESLDCGCRAWDACPLILADENPAEGETAFDG
jgi:DNA-binding transcriptional MerR regulator